MQTSPALQHRAAGLETERGSLVAPLIAAAVSAGLFWWILTRRFRDWVPLPDFRFHNEIAGRLGAGAPLEVPHPLYHCLVIAVNALLPGSGFDRAGFAVTLVAQVVLVLVVYAVLRSDVWPGPRPSPPIAAAMAFALCLIAPIYLLTPTSRELYFGYVFPNTFHNPTMILLRPLALGVFLVCAAMLIDRSPSAWLSTALTLACGLAKPNYLICLIPALAVTCLADYRRPGGAARGRVIIMRVLAPAIVLLALQTGFTLVSQRMEASPPGWAPLAVVLSYTRHSVPWVAVKLLLSVLFPLAVLVAFPEDARRDPALRLAWLAFAFGIVYAYGFAEIGPRFHHGNFLWSGQITLFVLFVASARLLLAGARGRPRDALRASLCAIVLLAHVGSGLAYVWRFTRVGGPF